MKTPLLILGDAPSAVTGLGRIVRDLSIRLATHCSDIYDVATLGYGGFGNRDLPFMQYAIESMENWFVPSLPDVWHDFAGERKGILLTIWDSSRILWLSRPDNPSTGSNPRVRAWLEKRPFELWGYFPIDAVGPNGGMSLLQREAMMGYDRILAYSAWAERITKNSMPDREVEALPHGIDTDVFHPQPRNRHIFHTQMGFNGPEIEPDQKIIGIVATNQIRKDWGLAIESLARVAKDIPIRIFIQVDTLDRHWSIPALLMDYGLIPNAIVNSNPLSDQQMSHIYSLCDLTLGIGLGEGYGYPIFESLACGTPCLTGSYGGQAEHMPDEMLVDPVAWRLEGLFNSRRPVFSSEKFAYRIAKMLRREKTGQSLLPAHLDWKNLWPRWEKWFRSGQTHLQPAPTPESDGSKSETDTAQSAQSKLKAVSMEDEMSTLDADFADVLNPEWPDILRQKAPER